MNAEHFLDTNILLYGVSKAPDELPKRQRSREILAMEGIGFSTQVFAEFYVNATRKQGFQLSHEQVLKILDPLRIFPVQPLTLEVVWEAFSICSEYQLSYWDSAIIAAAKALGCHTLWSEDLTHGQMYRGVLVQNPYTNS
jgi:predicted nucleic acid-binding protein